jgi:hypothetical protein
MRFLRPLRAIYEKTLRVCFLGVFFAPRTNFSCSTAGG